VWLDQSMQIPGLAMGRSIGDHLVKDVGVIAEPEVRVRELKKSDLVGETGDGYWFIVLASDGVWEFIDSPEACELVARFLPVKNASTEAATKLIENSAAKWRAEEGDYRDDITATVIRLKDLFDAGMTKD